jgi:hypothetical protein
MTGTGIVTNGEGKPCVSHLNLTRTMADVWREKPPARRDAGKGHQPEPPRVRIMGRPPGPPELQRIPYAGRDTR